MATGEKKKLDRQFRRFEKNLPDPVSKFIRWLRKPASRWVRIPVAILFIGGGLLGFLPVLGFWMVPLGLLLLAQDLPFLRKPIRKTLARAERCWAKLKKRFRGRG